MAWYEQQPIGDSSRFREHLIMGDRSQESQFGIAFSQPHAMAIADVNGDGLVDLVTGKRRWAHGPEGDIEPGAEPIVCWFELQRVGISWSPQVAVSACQRSCSRTPTRNPSVSRT